MLALLLGGPASLTLAFPASAQAHGIVGKADLPIPVWLFSWTAAIVLVVSFVALSTLWRTPQLQSEHRGRCPGGPARRRGAARLAPVLDALAGWSGWHCSRWCSTAALTVRRCPTRTSR